jgi:hypothetical protein
MSSTAETTLLTTVPSNAALWGGRVLGGLPGLLLLVDGVMKLFKPSFVVEATTQLGYPEHCIVPLGIALTISALLYLVPQTAVLGAILLTGYLGGAVATHVHADHGTIQIVFPALFAALLWGGLLLCDPRMRVLLPLRR